MRQRGALKMNSRSEPYGENVLPSASLPSAVLTMVLNALPMFTAGQGTACAPSSWRQKATCARAALPNLESARESARCRSRAIMAVHTTALHCMGMLALQAWMPL